MANDNERHLRKGGICWPIRKAVTVVRDWGYSIRPLQLSCDHWADKSDRFCSRCGARIRGRRLEEDMGAVRLAALDNERLCHTIERMETREAARSQRTDEGTWAQRTGRGTWAQRARCEAPKEVRALAKRHLVTCVAIGYAALGMPTALGKAAKADALALDDAVKDGTRAWLAPCIDGADVHQPYLHKTTAAEANREKVEAMRHGAIVEDRAPVNTTPEQRARILRDYENGMTFVELGRRYAMLWKKARACVIVAARERCAHA